MSQKIIIYQIFTRLYSNRNNTRKENGTIEENGCGKMNDITSGILYKIRTMGITHVWYTGILRHATTTDYTAYGIPRNHPAIVKGKAGSPYAITDYYDVDPDLAEDVAGRMAEFGALLCRTHRVGLKAIIDFVPNHVARQYHSICAPEGVEGLGEGDDPTQGFNPARNNFYYCPGQRFSPSFDLSQGATEPYVEEPAKATGNDHFDACPGVNDWYETVKLNYGVDYYAGGVRHFDPIPNTWVKMLQILEFWASKGVDGFRCDMAEMVPAEFWDWALARLKADYPNIIIIGEVYNPRLYRRYIQSGFDYLYDKVGMYDTLRAVTCGNAPASAITGAWQAVNDIGDKMLYFLENHDEQRVASDFFAGDGRKGIPALAVSLLLRGNPFMLYFGQQWGERGMDKEGFSGRDGRTTIFDYWSVDTVVRGVRGMLTKEEEALALIYAKLMQIAQNRSSIDKGEMFDLMYANPPSPHFDPRRHYAFLRKRGEELLLVVVNFGGNDENVAVTIPAHAFECLGIDEATRTTTDLINGRRHKVDFRKDRQISIPVGAYGVVVLKMRSRR